MRGGARCQRRKQSLSRRRRPDRNPRSEGHPRAPRDVRSSVGVRAAHAPGATHAARSFAASGTACSGEGSGCGNRLFFLAYLRVLNVVRLCASSRPGCGRSGLQISPAHLVDHV